MKDKVAFSAHAVKRWKQRGIGDINAAFRKAKKIGFLGSTTLYATKKIVFIVSTDRQVVTVLPRSATERLLRKINGIAHDVMSASDERLEELQQSLFHYELACFVLAKRRKIQRQQAMIESKNRMLYRFKDAVSQIIGADKVHEILDAIKSE